MAEWVWGVVEVARLRHCGSQGDPEVLEVGIPGRVVVFWIRREGEVLPDQWNLGSILLYVGVTLIEGPGWGNHSKKTVKDSLCETTSC